VLWVIVSLWSEVGVDSGVEELYVFLLLGCRDGGSRGAFGFMKEDV